MPFQYVHNGIYWDRHRNRTNYLYIYRIVTTDFVWKRAINPSGNFHGNDDRSWDRTGYHFWCGVYHHDKWVRSQFSSVKEKNPAWLDCTFRSLASQQGHSCHVFLATWPCPMWNLLVKCLMTFARGPGQLASLTEFLCVERHHVLLTCSYLALSLMSHGFRQCTHWLRIVTIFRQLLYGAVPYSIPFRVDI